MSNYLYNLVAKSLNLIDTLQPLLPSLFEPLQESAVSTERTDFSWEESSVSNKEAELETTTQTQEFINSDIVQQLDWRSPVINFQASNDTNFIHSNTTQLKDNISTPQYGKEDVKAHLNNNTLLSNNLISTSIKHSEQASTLTSQLSDESKSKLFITQSKKAGYEGQDIEGKKSSYKTFSPFIKHNVYLPEYTQLIPKLIETQLIINNDNISSKSNLLTSQIKTVTESTVIIPTIESQKQLTTKLLKEQEINYNQTVPSSQLALESKKELVLNSPQIEPIISTYKPLNANQLITTQDDNLPVNNEQLKTEQTLKFELTSPKKKIEINKKSLFLPGSTRFIPKLIEAPLIINNNASPKSNLLTSQIKPKTDVMVINPTVESHESQKQLTTKPSKGQEINYNQTVSSSQLTLESKRELVLNFPQIEPIINTDELLNVIRLFTTKFDDNLPISNEQSQEQILKFELTSAKNTNHIHKQPKKPKDELLSQQEMKNNLVNTFLEFDCQQSNNRPGLQFNLNNKNYPNKNIKPLIPILETKTNKVRSINDKYQPKIVCKPQPSYSKNLKVNQPTSFCSLYLDPNIQRKSSQMKLGIVTKLMPIVNKEKISSHSQISLDTGSSITIQRLNVKTNPLLPNLAVEKPKEFAIKPSDKQIIEIDKTILSLQPTKAIGLEIPFCQMQPKSNVIQTTIDTHLPLPVSANKEKHEKLNTEDIQVIFPHLSLFVPSEQVIQSNVILDNEPLIIPHKQPLIPAIAKEINAALSSYNIENQNDFTSFVSDLELSDKANLLITSSQVQVETLATVAPLNVQSMFIDRTQNRQPTVTTLQTKENSESERFRANEESEERVNLIPKLKIIKNSNASSLRLVQKQQNLSGFGVSDKYSNQINRIVSSSELGEKSSPQIALTRSQLGNLAIASTTDSILLAQDGKAPVMGSHEVRDENISVATQNLTDVATNSSTVNYSHHFAAKQQLIPAMVTGRNDILLTPATERQKQPASEPLKEQKTIKRTRKKIINSDSAQQMEDDNSCAKSSNQIATLNDDYFSYSSEDKDYFLKFLESIQENTLQSSSDTPSDISAIPVSREKIQQKKSSNYQTTLPSVQVSIGRLEIRSPRPSIPARSHPRPTSPSTPSIMNLERYLRQRAGGGER